MTARPHRSSRWVRTAVVAVAGTALAAHVVTGSALGGLQARVDNATNAAASGASVYTHSYNSQTCSSNTTPVSDTVSCPSSLFPATSAGSRSDAITANGTVAQNRVTEKVAVTSCGVVQLADSRLATNPQLPRSATTFGSTGPYGGAAAITLDGTSGYAAAVTSQTQPGSGLTLGSSYGIGIWFKTNTTLGGPLFSFGTSAANDATESFDRTLFMRTDGRLQFIYRTSGTATPASSNAFNNNAWHFAYVSINVAVLSLSVTVTLYVDGTQVGVNGGLLSGLDSPTGYWHLGWSPATSSVPRQYWAGSLADFAVLNNGSAPTNPTPPATQAAYDTFASAATDYWKLSDSGTTTASVTTLPVIGTASPCSFVDITWGFTSPTSCAIAPASTTAACTVTTTKLSAVSSTPITVGTVAPSTTQTSTITLTHDASYTGTAATFVAGLLILAPHQMSFAVGTTWTTTFYWTGTAAEFVL